MRNDDFEEPCALDGKDAPEYSEQQPERSVGPPWWEGLWPVGGTASLDDLGQ
jgi:hypothetical protein